MTAGGARGPACAPQLCMSNLLVWLYYLGLVLSGCRIIIRIPLYSIVFGSDQHIMRQWSVSVRSRCGCFGAVLSANHAALSITKKKKKPSGLLHLSLRGASSIIYRIHDRVVAIWQKSIRPTTCMNIIQVPDTLKASGGDQSILLLALTELNSYILRRSEHEGHQRPSRCLDENYMVS